MTVVEQVVEVWTAVSAWYVTTFQSVQPIFYNDEKGLTFVGVLACIGAGLSIIMGLVMVIRSFLKAH